MSVFQDCNRLARSRDLFPSLVELLGDLLRIPNNGTEYFWRSRGPDVGPSSKLSRVFGLAYEPCGALAFVARGAFSSE